jgi:hypothetical protein
MSNKISQQSENCENHNEPDLVQAFLKKWWVESDFTAQTSCFHYGLKVPVVTITVFSTLARPSVFIPPAFDISYALSNGFPRFLVIDRFCLFVYLRNNNTVFEELELSVVDLTVANAVLLAIRL